MTVGDESPGGLLIHAHRLRERFGEQPELDPAELQATLGLASAAARWDVAAIVANIAAEILLAIVRPIDTHKDSATRSAVSERARSRQAGIFASNACSVG